MDTTTTKTILILRVDYEIVDDGAGGSDVAYCHVDAKGCPLGEESAETFDPRWDDSPVAFAVQLMRNAGTITDNGSWWSQPEPYSNPYTGTQTETTAHLDGFTDAELDAIGACLTDVPWELLPAGVYGMAAAEPLTRD